MIIGDAQRGARGKCLIQLIVESETFAAEKVGPVAVFVDTLKNAGVAHFVPFVCGQSGEHEENHQEHTACADPRRPRTSRFGLLILDELDHAPEDKENRPVLAVQRQK